jgi:riboflavin synthase
VQRSVFEVYLIPHTLEVTTLGRLRPGGRVNLEVDLIARYVSRSLEWYEVEQRQGKP